MLDQSPRRLPHTTLVQAVSARSVSLSPKLDVVSKAKESLKLGTVTTCSTASSLGKNFVPSSNSTNPAVGDFLGLTFDFDLEQVVRAASALRPPRARGASARVPVFHRCPVWFVRYSFHFSSVPFAWMQVTGGQVYYNCTVNGFLPYNTVDDLCADQEDGPDPCPLGVGHHTVSSSSMASRMTAPTLSATLPVDCTRRRPSVPTPATCAPAPPP